MHQTRPLADLIFNEPRLADIYDHLDSDRSDLDLYLSIAEELGARSAVDIGCGTGTLACLLADRGLEVVGVDPAAAMLNVARRKTGADRVRWVHGTAEDLPPMQLDLATMTGNVAQVFLTDEDWMTTLSAAHRVLRPAGALVFESRRPERQAWLDWNRSDSFEQIEIDGLGVVETWDEVVDVSLPLVRLRHTIVFHEDLATLVSESTLRFRTYEELVTSVETAGFRVDEVRDAPDRPGKEFVVLATRQDSE